MIDLEKLLSRATERHPVAATLVAFVLALSIILTIAWFLLFSGLTTSADFVYNQF